MLKVTSLDHLKQLATRANGDLVEFYIMLAGGICRSCKRISYRETEIKNWLIINEIDDSYQELKTDKSLSKNTLIVEAIEKGAFFLSDMP